MKSPFEPKSKCNQVRDLSLELQVCIALKGAHWSHNLSVKKLGIGALNFNCVWFEEVPIGAIIQV